MDLQTPVRDVSRIYKMYASRLEKLGIKKIEDFLYHIPFRYDDYSLISKIKDVQPGEIVTIQGEIIEIKTDFTRRFKTLQRARVKDETGEIAVTWFNQPYIVKSLAIGDTVALSGKVEEFLHKIVLQSPEYELLIEHIEPIHTSRLVPIYPETKGVSSKWLRRQTSKFLQNQVEKLLDHIPDSILTDNQFLSIQNAIKEIHFPKSLESADEARRRLAFDELFLLQLSAMERKSTWLKQTVTKPLTIKKFRKHIDAFIASLPFQLTAGQEKAVDEILSDLEMSKPMNRLLEGDVGSGKTVVGMIAMYASHLNGLQSVIMAPTEILANQHYNTISNLLEPLGVKISLATGSNKLKIEDSAFHILVGTHAVLSKKIAFEKLGLVIIDEQQRFGVRQRALIKDKGVNPHLLTMTATPIPRTVALTIYGDLDLSTLGELPKGRKLIKTWLVAPEKRDGAYEWMEEQIAETGSQAFIICPFIEESENMTTVKAASQEFERLKKEVFSKNMRLGLLHGKLKSKEKDAVLQQFKNKEFDILVATPVVEVGIDIPNATIMLIEATERFGLAQLHQLRGRVGRGEKQSYCLLFTDSKNPTTLKKLKSMETMHIGSELAELDLSLRGPGDLYGTMQHGMVKLKIANFFDQALIRLVRNEANKIFPNLDSYPILRDKLRLISTENVTPD